MFTAPPELVPPGFNRFSLNRMVCDSCGEPADHSDPDGEWASCDACERRHQDQLDQDYPLGMCSHCGAAGYSVRRYDALKGDFVKVIEFSHAEGECPHWYDPGAAMEWLAYLPDAERAHMPERGSAWWGEPDPLHTYTEGYLARAKG